jgi:hypothetical protein
MKQASGARILAHLAAVADERRARAADLSLGQRVEAIKRYQQRRFEKSYADLLVHPRYFGASRFFLEELYGPTDFTQRDEQFARVVPPLVHLFPAEVVQTVEALAALHALSERFDTAMGGVLSDAQVDAERYLRAWQSTDDAPGRERQIALMERVGYALDVLTRKPMLRHSLRLMRTPARAAGLGALQSFLEAGFDTFRGMSGAAGFLALIGERERDLTAALFAADLRQASRLGQLP